jgi:hypothetical protein
MNRPYQPEERSIPLTFMDCPDRGEGKPVISDRVIGHWCNYHGAMFGMDKYCYCEGAIAHGMCPRGFR